MTLTALRSMGIGVGGSLILALFCTTFLPVHKVLALMPVLLGVNGLLSGYRILDHLKGRIRRIHLFPAVMGLGEGAAVFLAMNFAGNTLAGNTFSLTIAGTPSLLNGWDLLLYLSVSGVTSYLGARLAARYFNL